MLNLAEAESLSSHARDDALVVQAGDLAASHAEHLREDLAMPQNRRDKWVVITPRGKVAQAGVVRQVTEIEEEITTALGSMDLETFRKALLSVLEGMSKKVALGEKTLPPAATRLE